MQFVNLDVRCHYTTKLPMKKDDLIAFGNYKWRILDIKEDRALIITEEIIELRWYNDEFVDITWENCSLRKYLNHDFLETFNTTERTEIITVKNNNHDNPWFKTKGGNETIDNIFLLSLEEVCKYFGDSRENLSHKDKQKWLINDENNQRRQAEFGKENHWWRLRSPGYYSRTSASVNSKGNVYVRGNGVYGRPKDGGGIRPVLWLKIKN